MPIDLMRPKKIPVGDKGGTLQRFEAERADDGSWIVTCYHEGGEMGMFGGGKKYTVSNDSKLKSLIAKKVSGETPDEPEMSPEPRTPRPVRKAAPVVKAAAAKAVPKAPPPVAADEEEVAY